MCSEDESNSILDKVQDVIKGIQGGLQIVIARMEDVRWFLNLKFDEIKTFILIDIALKQLVNCLLMLTTLFFL